jgi:hypothetical protein
MTSGKRRGRPPYLGVPVEIRQLLAWGKGHGLVRRWRMGAIRLEFRQLEFPLEAVVGRSKKVMA